MSKDAKTEVANQYLMVSQGGVYPGPTMVQTVLGSCVSVTFFSPVRHIGAVFHALLPRWQLYEKDPKNINYFRYVDSAIHFLLNDLFKRGVSKQELECKVFGGSNAMFEGELGAGKHNVEAAMETLAAYQLKIVASSVGGNRGRKLIFYTHTGDVFIKLQQPPAFAQTDGGSGGRG